MIRGQFIFELEAKLNRGYSYIYYFYVVNVLFIDDFLQLAMVACAVASGSIRPIQLINSILPCNITNQVVAPITYIFRPTKMAFLFFIRTKFDIDKVNLRTTTKQ